MKSSTHVTVTTSKVISKKKKLTKSTIVGGFRLFFGGDHKSTLPHHGASFCSAMGGHIFIICNSVNGTVSVWYFRCVRLWKGRAFVMYIFSFFAQGARFPQASGYWLSKSSIEATQAWQGFSPRRRIRQNGLYLILQSLIRQTSPFLPLGPASPCRKERRESRNCGRGEEEKVKKRKKKARRRQKWRETVRKFCLHIKGWVAMSEELCSLALIADAQVLSLLSKPPPHKTF